MAVSAATIKPKVISTIKRALALDQNTGVSVTDGKKLADDLDMSRPLRQALATPFTKISKRHGGKTVSIADCGKLKTVGDAVTLVNRRANGLNP